MQRRVRQEEQVAELCAGVVRAFSGERDLHFRGKRLHRGRVALPWFAPHLHPFGRHRRFRLVPRRGRWARIAAHRFRCGIA
jgi:hypothetical protein